MLSNWWNEVQKSFFHPRMRPLRAIQNNILVIGLARTKRGKFAQARLEYFARATPGEWDWDHIHNLILRLPRLRIRSHIWSQNEHVAESYGHRKGRSQETLTPTIRGRTNFD